MYSSVGVLLFNHLTRYYLAYAIASSPLSGRRHLAPGEAKRNAWTGGITCKPAKRATDMLLQSLIRPPSSSRLGRFAGYIPQIPLRSIRGYMPTPASQADSRNDCLL